MRWWNRLSSFLREVAAETKKVTWPSKKEVVATTSVVIVASFIFGIYLYICDIAFSKMVFWIFRFFGVSS